MNVILSRKGTDSGSGGIYSPLDPISGEYAFLMRPESEKTSSETYTGIPYSELPTNFLEFSNSAELLQARDKLPSYGAHVDPDLVKVLPVENWKPIFGQRGAAQGYLRNRGVGMVKFTTLIIIPTICTSNSSGLQHHWYYRWRTL